MTSRKISSKSYSPELLDLMVGMTRANVNDRYTMDKIRAHPWF